MNPMRILGVICSALVIGALWGGTSQATDATQVRSAKLSIQVVVERQKGDQWEQVDPQTVFHTGDVIRFRFRASSGVTCTFWTVRVTRPRPGFTPGRVRSSGVGLKKVSNT